jgi:putative heme-binding domain-containing protein
LALQRISGRLAGDWKELAGTKELEAGVSAGLSEPDLQLETINLIGDARIASLADPLIRILANTTDHAVRIASISALGNLNTPDAHKALSKQLHHSEKDVQAAALKALLVARAFDELAAMLADPAFSESFKLDAIRWFAERVDGCFFLLSLIDDHKLSDPLKAEAIKLASRHPDGNVRQLFAKYTQDQPKPATIAELDAKQVLSLTGDAAHGRQLFAESAAKCTTCHRVGSQGTDVGPDLTLIGRKYGREALLDQIMRPAAAVAPEYTPYLIETTSQGFMLGFVLQDTKDLVEVKTSDGLRQTMPRDQVTSVEKQKGTLMPDLLLESFPGQDVADLVAYLAGLKTAPQPVTKWRVAGPFPDNEPTDLDKVYPPEEPRGAIEWKAVKPALVEGRYALDIQKLSPLEPVQAIFYLSAQIDSPQAQEARFEVENAAGIKVFLNGQVIHQGRQRRNAHTAIARAPLVLGHNALLIKIERAASEARLSVQLEAPQPVQLVVE